MSRPRPKPRSRPKSYPSLDMLPPLPADKFAGAQRQKHCSPPHKTKRLKTRKERNQIRGPYISSFFQSHVKRVSKDKTQGCSCQESHSGHSRNNSRKDKAIAKPFPLLRPSIITEGRLTSIRGLFSHEVRSVDIERLMTGQRKRHSQDNDHQGQAAADNSPPVLSTSLFSPRPGSDEPDASIHRCVQDGDLERTSEQTEHLQTITEEHSYMQTCYEASENVIGSGNRSKNTGTRPVVLSSPESDFIQSISTDPANKTNPSFLPGEPEEEQSDKTTSALDKQQKSHNPLMRSLQSNPTVCSTSPPADKAQQKEPGALITNEAVSRLAARLCQNLQVPTLRCRCPLLTECRGVLLQTLQERNCQAGLHSRLTTPIEPSDPGPHVTEQASTRSEQRYVESTPMLFSFTEGYEAGLQSGSTEIWAYNKLHREEVFQDSERGAADRRRRLQAWTVYSPQDVLTKVQLPCEDILDHWSVRMPIPESLTAHQHHRLLQGVSQHQAFPRIETPTPYSNRCGPVSAEPCLFLKPQKQSKLSINQNTVREINELLDQWSSDPDLAFLFHENPRKSHTSLDLPTELNASPPYQQAELTRTRPHVGASSTVSAFFPPEGFSYEPYYRFPHPFNYTNRPERPSTSLYHLSDIRDLGLSPSLLLNTPYFRCSL